jgi:hypothetical protein
LACYFSDKEILPIEQNSDDDFETVTNKTINKITGAVFTAPLYQQAFRWLRKKHGLVSYLRWNDRYKPISWEWVIEGEKFGGETECRKGWIYEEAELACLKKLIKIVQDETLEMAKW